MEIIIVIISLVLSILVLVWLHNVSLNTYKIFTLLKEWNYEYKQLLEEVKKREEEAKEIEKAKQKGEELYKEIKKQE